MNKTWKWFFIIILAGVFGSALVSWFGIGGMIIFVAWNIYVTWMSAKQFAVKYK